ncbi:hypothetical protein [Sphingomonas sp. HMP6]|uniref:hypothetical protein n=1 Tax=Sphingomonas sp. HMP6 TaxID=1517551 RepID=UPI001596BA95|nr:hypothetical protein [Sphingomonas sp. HMP6]BCA58129.1 hypothetical protein HMP06_0898 [Sphingomonas sp. HMP6]
MAEDNDVAAGLERLAKAVGGYTAVARKLSISRQDLWRYRTGRSTPRPALMRRMLTQMPPPGRADVYGSDGETVAHLDRESVTKLRGYLLHLVHLLDLDERTRSGPQREGG